MKNTKIDQKKLREVAACFTTGVAVVTIEAPDGSIHGMTVNSFLSVSLDPPLILFSVQNETAILKQFGPDSKICISILNADQVHVSNKFAGIEEETGEITFISSDQYHIIDECLAWYKTTLNKIIPAGDHQLILCEILDLGKTKLENPLLYFGAYRTIGNKI